MNKSSFLRRNRCKYCWGKGKIEVETGVIKNGILRPITYGFPINSETIDCDCVRDRNETDKLTSSTRVRPLNTPESSNR